VIDVGAGGGAPTIPLALLRPDLGARLVEPRQKRGAFLRTACASLDLLGRVNVEQGRIEPDAPEVDAGDFDLALSRATFAPEIWVPLGLRLAPRCVALLGSADWSDEERAPVDARDYIVPSSGAKRRALLFER
jgi:16S rRNA (guanine527-N7)-methyltransferase